MGFFFDIINNMFSWSFLLYINSLLFRFICLRLDIILFSFWLTGTLLMIFFTVSEMLVISFLNELPLAERTLYHCLISIDFIAYPIKLFNGLNIPALCLI